MSEKRGGGARQRRGVRGRGGWACCQASRINTNSLNDSLITQDGRPCEHDFIGSPLGLVLRKQDKEKHDKVGK